MAAPLPGVWGIDVGQCAVKAIRLQDSNGEVTATAFDYIEYPKILSQPDADPDQLTREALEQFLSRNKIKGDMVVIAVPGQSGLARFVKLPPVEEKKVADIVRFEAKQQIPFPLEEVVWDFQKLGSGEVTDGFAMGTEIGLFALKRDMVFRYLQHFKDVNVEVHVVQMAPLALCNYVAYDLISSNDGEGEEGDKKKKCIVALDIGTDNSNLVITDGDCIIWQRPIPLGGNHFTRALTKDMKLTFAKAEHLKKNAVKSPDLKKILASLKTVLNDFVGEVQRSLGYFTNTHRDAQVQYMIGLGNAFRLPGLQKYLQEKLQLEVRKLTKLEKVQGEEVTAAPTFIENLPGFSVAYGLALQGLNKTRLHTNLLPYEVRVERLVRGKKPWAVTAAAILIVAVAGLTYARSVEKKEINRPEIGQAMKKVDDALAKKTKFAGDYKSKEDELAKSKDAIEKLAAGVKERFNWQLLHQYINLALPQPNGSKVPVLTQVTRVDARNKYYTPEAKEAFALLEEKRFAKATPSPAKLAEIDTKIKKHLIQVNIEAVASVYSEDLSEYYKRIKPDRDTRLRGMNFFEAKKVVEFIEKGDKADMPMSGWVVEIRGYTYHKDEFTFVEDTFVENLNYPLTVPENKELLESENGKNMMKRVKEKMSFLFIYKAETVPDPVPGVFPHIGKSALPFLVEGAGGGQQGGGGMPGMPAGGGGADPKGGGGPPAAGGPGGPGGAGGGGEGGKKSRAGWQPVGENARGGNSLGGGGNDKAGRQPRTEFILLFIWEEPFLGAPEKAPAAAAAAGGAPATEK